MRPTLLDWVLRRSNSSQATVNRRFAQLAVEVLEDRAVPSAVSLVKDIVPGVTASNPSNLLNVNGTVYFTTGTGASTFGLWASDGIDSGTRLIKQFSLPTGVAELTNVNGTIFFAVDESSNNTKPLQLWKSDGTTAGTVPVKYISPISPAALRNFTNVNGTLFFTADDGSHGEELWKSDGTDQGTVLVRDIRASGGSNPRELTNVNGTLYFTADDGVNGYELWRSDGTEQGTVLIHNIHPTAASSPANLVNVNGTLYFSANNGANGVELWKYTGATGATIVKDINAGAAASAPEQLTNVNGILFFRATNGINGLELWRSDGTSDGTLLVKDIHSLGDSKPAELVNVNGTLFFVAGTADDGPELWKSDGTSLGTVLVKNVGAGLSSPTKLTNVNGLLYFTADDGINGRELWQSDGTATGTTILHINLATGVSSNPDFLTSAGGTLFFAANNGVHGTELWKLTAFNDSFSRVNSNYFIGDWGTASGDFAIIDQQLVAIGEGTNTATVFRLNTHVRVQSEVSVLTTGGSRVDLMARRQGNGNAYLGSLVGNDGFFSVVISKLIDGVVTNLASRPVAVADDGVGVLRFEVAGNNLKLYFQNVLLLSLKDSTIGLAGYTGVRGTAYTTFDDFFMSPIELDLRFGDNFNRADGTSLGTQWLETSGDLIVKGNQLLAKGSGANLAIHNGPVINDVIVRADVKLLPFGSSFAGVVARYTGPGDKGYLIAGLFGSNGTYTARIGIGYPVSGYTVVFTLGSGPGVAQGSLRFEVVGGSLKLFVNDVLVAKAVTSSSSFPGQVGIRASALATIDNFNAEAAFPTVFHDSFQNMNSWTTAQGSAALEAGKLVMKSDGVNTQLRSGITPTISYAKPLSLQVDVNLVSGTAGLVAGYQNLSNYYYATVTKISVIQTVNIYRVVNGVTTSLLSRIVATSIGTLRFEISRFFGTQTLAVTFNGIRYSVADSTLLAAGLAGVRGTKNTSFDNFVMAQ